MSGADQEPVKLSAAKALEKASPESWPAPWNRAKNLPATVRPETDQAILTAIRGAHAKAGTPPARISRTWWAAAALIPIALGVYLFLARGEQPADSGVVMASTPGTRLPPGSLVSGSRIKIKEGGTARLEIQAAGKAVFVAGPAHVRVQKRAGEVELHIENGRFMLVSRPNAGAQKLVFITNDVQLRPLGTSGRLIVHADSTRLTVVEGSFEARFPDGRPAMRIPAGRTWLYSKGRAETKPAPAGESDHVTRVEESWRRGDPVPARTIQAPLKKPAAKPRPKKPSVTIQDIRRKYGNVHKVRLRDGSMLLGHVRLITRDSITVVTVKGEREIPRADVVSMNVH